MQDDFVRSLKKRRTFHLCADDPTKRKGGEFWCIFCTFSPPKREKEGESGGGNSERKHIGDETRAEQHRNTLSVGGCLTPVDPDAVGPRSADGGKGGPLCCSQRRVIQETISAGRGGGGGGDLCSSETRFRFSFPGINASVYCGSGSLELVQIVVRRRGGNADKGDRFVGYRSWQQW